MSRTTCRRAYSTRQIAGVVFPSVVKAAFLVGGSYGRGAMTCRQGENFQGPWGAPTMMALEGGSFGFQIGGTGNGILFCWL